MKYCFVVFNDIDNNVNSWVNIGYIASYLETYSDFSVEFKFYRADEVHTAVQEMNLISPDVIGLPMLQHNFNSVLTFSEEIKKYLPKIFIIVGNKDAVCYGEYIMAKNKAVDAVVLGEGEKTTFELCKRLATNQDIYDCPGLLLRQNDGFIATPKRELIEKLDELPFPYRGYRIGDSNVYNIIGSRGCVGKCSFCEANTVFGENSFLSTPVRCRSISNILDEVASLYKNNSFIVVNFLDSTFCSNDSLAVSRLEELYAQILERRLNFQFNLNVRSEQVDDRFVKCLIDLSKVGLDSILIGVEAGNQDDIKLYNKGAGLDQHVKAICLLRNALEKSPNIFGVEYGFINFNPYSTLDKLQANADFIEKNSIELFPYDILSKLRISGSTKITKKIISDGLLTCDIGHPIVDPYAYKFIDERIYILYNILERAYTCLNAPNTSMILSKIRRFSLKHDFEQDKLEKVLNLNKTICEVTLHIFKLALSTLKNETSIDVLWGYVEEQGREIYNEYIEVKKIENRVSIELFKLGELPRNT